MITLEGIQASGKSTISDYLAELLDIPFVPFGTRYTNVYETLVSYDGNYKRFDIVSLFRRMLTMKCAQFDGLRFFLQDAFITNEYYHVLHHSCDLPQEEQTDALKLIIDMLNYGNVQHEPIAFYLHISTEESNRRRLLKRSGESAQLNFTDEELKIFEDGDKKRMDMLHFAAQCIPNFYILDNSGNMETTIEEILTILEKEHGF